MEQSAKINGALWPTLIPISVAPSKDRTGMTPMVSVRARWQSRLTRSSPLPTR